MKILFIDTVHPFLKDSLERKGHLCEEAYQWSREEILNRLADYEGVVIRSRIKLDKEFLDRADRLIFIARAGAGMENVDVAYAESKNISCLNAPEGNRDAVGEHAIAMLLSLFNNLDRAGREVREGKWFREPNRGVELQGKTVGIIGYGNTGSAFAKKLTGFDCRVMAYDKYRDNFQDKYTEEATMEKIFNEADILSMHVPFTAETQYLVDREFIGRFRKNIYIVNTSRGQCLKTADLVEGLVSGKVRGACLDVLEYEDSSFENISAQESNDWKYLLSSDRVVLSPHIAGWTHESNEKMAKILFEKISSLE